MQKSQNKGTLKNYIMKNNPKLNKKFFVNTDKNKISQIDIPKISRDEMEVEDSTRYREDFLTSFYS
jgi:hypothetical protein